MKFAACLLFALLCTTPALAAPGDIFSNEPSVTCDAKGHDLCVPKIRINSGIDAKVSARFVKWIAEANAAGASRILVEINTPGGSIPDGFEMAKAIEASEAPVTCVVDGEADSMGFYLLQSCAHRVMTHRSKLMTHEPSVGVEMSGQPNEWQSLADAINAERAAMAAHCQHRLKISMEEYRAHTDGGKQWWILPAEALKITAVDEVVDGVEKLHKRLIAKGK